MKWNYTNLVALNLVFIILCGFGFTTGHVAMGFAFAVCAVLMLIVIMTCYLGNHIPTDRS